MSTKPTSQPANQTSQDEKPWITIGIIGASGRQDIITFCQFSRAAFACTLRIGKLRKTHRIHLVSGGSAGMDHLVVHIAKLYADKVSLELPCSFHDNTFANCKSGDMLNNLHKLFSKNTLMNHGNTSRQQLHELIQDDTCETTVHNGFYARNRVVAKKADILWSFNHGNVPKGGTKYTVNIFKRRSDNHEHFDLNAL